MKRFTRDALFRILLPLCALTLGTELWLLWRARRETTQALAGLEQKKREREWLAGRNPAPTAASEQAIAEDLARAGAALAELRAMLQPGGGNSLPSPAQSIDAYFDIATFLETTRSAAARAQVTTKPDECFGFKSYANAGPEIQLAPAVFRQRVMTARLLDALIESHPHAVLDVRREHPRPTAGREPGGHEVGADYFEFSPPVSLRTPGPVRSEAFRLEFTGRTPVLRDFLNRLAALAEPVLVRSLDVEPVDAGPAVDPKRAPTDPAPWVAATVSKFIVVVECVELASGDGREER